MAIAAISYGTIAHSTEDVAKVESALLSLLPVLMRPSRKASVSEATGHHGNPIRLLNLDVKGKDDPDRAFDYLLRILPVADRMVIRDQIMTYWDGRSTVFLRLDKQSCLMGQPRLSTGDDVVRVKVSLQGGKHTASSVLDAFELG